MFNKLSSRSFGTTLIKVCGRSQSSSSNLRVFKAQPITLRNFEKQLFNDFEIAIKAGRKQDLKRSWSGSYGFEPKLRLTRR